jgi:two-component system, NarL family, invasion response regulator UvrY
LRKDGSIKTVPPANPRVLVVSDQALVRAGYSALLQSAGIRRTDVAPSAAEGIEMAAASHWDMAILDLSNLDDCVAALAALRNGSPGLPILVMSDVPERQVAHSILKAGARGYFHKAGSAAALKSAVHTILAGRRYVSAALSGQLKSDAGEEWGKALHERLSTREWEIFKRLASGATVTSIGRELSLSVKTVSTYRTRLLQKMGFSSNAEIITYAMRNGLLR